MEKRQLYSLEEKFIANQMSGYGYQGWQTDISRKIAGLPAEVRRLSGDCSAANAYLFEYLEMLSDLRMVCEPASISQKHELLKLVFDQLL